MSNSTILLGTSNGSIINLEIKETKKKNKSDFNVQLINQTKLENSKSIQNLIGINNNIFISHDEDKNNILWENYEIKKELTKGNITLVKNILIVLNDTTNFYDIKNNFEEIAKIDIKLANHIILEEDYMIGEDYSDNNKLYLINIKEKELIKEILYEPKKKFILDKICGELMFKLVDNEKTTLINVKLEKNDDNKSCDLIAQNKNSLIIESGPYSLNLFNGFFIICKKN